MNLYDLLNVIGETKEDFVLEAIETRNRTSTKRISMRRPFLIAAVVAIMLLLVGCAVAYVLRLQDMSVGKETYTQNFDDSGKAIEPIEKERDVLTLFGHSGDPIQQATKEWFDFLETYDPDGALRDNNPDHPEIPNQYEYTYSCYTQEMADKVDEIAEKYGLKLLEEGIPFQAWQSDIFLEESGIGSLVLPDSGAEITRLSGMFYLPHNFNLETELKLKGMDTKVWLTVIYARKDYFPRDYPGGTDLSLYDQWDYTASGGTALLLALSSKGHGYIIAELSDAMMILSIDGNFSGSAYPTAEEIITKAQLEAVADVFDYSIQPQILDREPVMERLAESDAAHDAETAYEPETYTSFSEVLKSLYVKPDNTAQYAFFDLTGDGIEELLLDFSGDGAIDEWYTAQNGEIQQFWENGIFLCEGWVIEQRSPYPERDEHFYRKADSDTAWMDLDSESQGDRIATLLLHEGKWTYSDPDGTDALEISQEEAQAIMAQYPRISLDWKPLKNYPLSESQTMQDYWNEKDVRVSDAELLDIYKTYLQDLESINYSHYRILDINGDGVEDLLLKRENDSLLGNTDYYCLALTYRYGIVTGFASDFYLCEDGVLEHVDTRHAGDLGVEKDGHEFLRCDGLETEVLDFVVYNKSNASWYGDWWDEIPITEEEANAILAKYPRIDQGMRPISELYN